MSATYPVPDNPTNIMFGNYPRPFPPAVQHVGAQEQSPVIQQLAQQLKSKRARRKEMHPPQRTCSENNIEQLNNTSIGTYHKTKPIIDYATPIVIEPHAERDHGRMDMLFNKGQHNMCSQYTDFHWNYNSQSPSPSPTPPRDSAMDDACQDSGVSDGLTPPPGTLDRSQYGQPIEQLERLVVKMEENPTIGTVSMVEAAPIVIEPVVDDMVQMKQAYGSTQTTPSRTPSHMIALPEAYPNGYRYNSCYQTPPPHHYWPGPTAYVGGQFTAIGTLTPYHPVNFNHIPPVNQNRYPLVSQKLVNSSPWRNDVHRDIRPGHPYYSTPPRAQHTVTLQPLVIQPVPMDLPRVACQNRPHDSSKPEDDDDRAIMVKSYTKKERQVSVNISGTCCLDWGDIARMQRQCLTLGWCTQNLEMSVENQIIEFDVEERKIDVSVIKSGPPCEQEVSEYHYGLLEKRLPRHLKVHIDVLKEKAAKHEGGNFFDNIINKDLMYIEQACGKLSAFNHKLVYEHLAQHLPCSMATLRRHAETLALAAVRRKLRNLMYSLYHRLKKEMPYQIERHLWECSVATKLQLQQQVMAVQSPTRGRPDVSSNNHQLDSSTLADQHHMPGKSFLWTEVTRQLIWDILKTKLATYPSKKAIKAKMANFKRLQEFVQRHVVSAWPEGWMDTETILSESCKVQKQLRGTSDLLDL